MEDKTKITKEDIDDIQKLLEEAVDNNQLIIATQGSTILIGKEAQLLSSLTCIMNALLEGGTSKELIQKSIDLAGLSTEELAERAKDLINKYMKDLMNRD